MSSPQTSALPDDYADYLAWKNQRHHPLVRVVSSSTISTNATASNLEGAGRTVGLLFERLGAHVDAFLNEWASRHGYGPRAIAQEIRQQLRHDERTFLQRQANDVQHFSKPEGKALRRKCLKLLKFAKNKISSTQFQSLDEIIRLAIEDPVARMILAQCNLEKYLKPRFKEPELFLSTSRALEAIEDEKIHNLWRRLPELLVRLSKVTHISSYDESREPGNVMRREECLRMHSYLCALKMSMRDPALSWIACRYIYENFKVASMDGSYAYAFLNCLQTVYYENAVLMPSVIEWHTVDKLYAIQSLSDDDKIKAAGTLLLNECYDTWCELKESVSISHLLQVDGRNVYCDNISKTTLSLCSSFFESHAKSRRLVEHINYIRQMDRQLRIKLEATLLISEVAAAACQIFKPYRDWVLKLVGSNQDEDEDNYACAIIASHLESERDSGEGKELASLVSELCYKENRYIKAMMIGAKSERNISVISPEETNLFSWRACTFTNAGPRPLRLGRFRIGSRYVGAWMDCDITYGFIRWNSDGDDVTKISSEARRLWRKFYSYNNSPDPSDMSADSMFVPVGNALSLHVVDGQGFEVDGHFPILAGHDVTGEPLYIATQGDIENSYVGELFAFVKNGARYATFIDKTGNNVEWENFYLLVLRHDPVDFHPGVPGGADSRRCAEDAIDPTGPLCWVHDDQATAVLRRLGEDKGYFDSEGQDSKLLEGFRTCFVAQES